MGGVPAAIRRLLARQQVEIDHAEPLAAPGTWRISGRRWVAVEVPGRALPLYVALPVCVEVGRAGRRYAAEIPPPSPEELAEAGGFARSLVVHGQIGARGAASHEIVVDAEGREKLVRRGFSTR